MIRLGKCFWMAFLLTLLASALNGRAATNAAPDFKEVYDLIRAHVAGAGDAQLNRAAVNGLLKELGPKASLVTGDAETSTTVVTQLVSKAFVFDGEIAYLRVARVSDGLATELRATYQQLSASNTLKGAVLDLRFADGTDYPAAIAAAELFSLKKPVTLDWGKGVQETKTGNELISVPLVVLVNGQTSVAAETLATMLREGGAGLLLGNPTAGQALSSQDFPLSNGATLRVATTAVKLNGTELSQIHPDIDVAVSAKDEQTFFADSYFVLPKPNSLIAGLSFTNRAAATNASGRRARLNEAGLVRAHKQGLNPDDEEGAAMGQARDNKPAAPVVNDPVLARALDLLKGLAIVRQPRP